MRYGVIVLTVFTKLRILQNEHRILNHIIVKEGLVGILEIETEAIGK